ncbi:hypothetical protein D3C85_1701880 [compost metagenome]
MPAQHIECLAPLRQHLLALVDLHELRLFCVVQALFNYVLGHAQLTHDGGSSTPKVMRSPRTAGKRQLAAHAHALGRAGAFLAHRRLVAK